MVRLRSNRWYGQGGQRRIGSEIASRSSGVRNVVSLCLLLAMVIALMQTMADPKSIQSAFSSLGVPLETKSSFNHPERSLRFADNNTQITDQSATDVRRADAKWVATCRDLVRRLLDLRSGDQINLIAQRWFAGHATDVVDESDVDQKIALLREQSILLLARLKRQLDAEPNATSQSALGKLDGSSQEWQSLFSRFEAEWDRLLYGLVNHNSAPLRNASISSNKRHIPEDSNDQQAKPLGPKNEFDAIFSEAFGQYLDERLTQALRDGQTWQTTEFVAFWRTMQRASELSKAIDSSHLPLVNAHQLESRAANYRGKTVTFRGSVRRIEKIERANQAFGFDAGYWQLWLRGEDDSTQPIAVYSTDSSIEKFNGSDSAYGNAPTEIELSAIVSKRLAYASLVGIEVAPTLFALRIKPVESNLASTTRRSMSTESWRGNGLTAVISALLAAAMVVVLVVRFRKRRRNRVRKRVDSYRAIPSLCLAVWSFGLGNLQAQQDLRSSVSNDFKLPWAEPESQSAVILLLDQRLTEAMQGDSLKHIGRYLAGTETSEFPNAILRVLNNASRIGWPTIASVNPNTKFAGGSMSLAEFRGFVRLAAVEPLTSDQTSWFSGLSDDRVYRLEMEVDESTEPHEVNQPNGNEAGQPRARQRRMLTIFCQSVPQLWLSSVQLRQPATVRGFAVHWDRDSQVVHPSESNESTVCLIADQPMWLFPSGIAASDLQPALPEDHFVLGLAGWNLSWLELLAQNNQGLLSSKETHAFYSMLRAAQKLPSGSSTIRTVTPMKVFKEQKDSIAKKVRWQVRVVKGSVVPVRVDEERRILGSEHFFQFDGFVDLDGQRVKYSPQSSGSEINQAGAEFEGEFPITLVSSSMPVGFDGDAATHDGSQAWDIGKHAIAEGIFYRLWSYRSERLSTPNNTARQVAPLVVLTSLTPYRAPVARFESGTGWVSYALSAAIIGCLSMIWYLVLSQGKRGRH